MYGKYLFVLLSPVKDIDRNQEREATESTVSPSLNTVSSRHVP